MKILITGGSGYLGRGIQKFWPENDYVVLSRDEYKQDIAKQVLDRNNTKWILGDVQDQDRLFYTMKDVDLVIHAAAIKYIPEAEFNVDECVKVNVDGSRNVITAALKAGVPRVVGISTDKAVQPVNTYGMTKAIMERLFAEANNYGKTIFSCTRYGNVVGSTGSVLTVFNRQLETTGILTITDPTMTRYWQSLQQSVDLVRFAAQAGPGEIVIPRGASMSMGKLADYLATSHGLLPKDHIKVIGVRPGEKMHESLAGAYELPRIERQATHYILHRVGALIKNDLTCPLTSDKPDDELTFNQMDYMIKESQCV